MLESRRMIQPRSTGSLSGQSLALVALGTRRRGVVGEPRPEGAGEAALEDATVRSPSRRALWRLEVAPPQAPGPCPRRPRSPRPIPASTSTATAPAAGAFR